MTASRTITDLVVHCSATPNGRPVTAADITRWHKQRGFRTIGYHYVIRVDGSVETGRPEAQIGAHVEGHNAKSIGICMVGGTDDKGRPNGEFAKVQFTSLSALLTDLRKRFPKARILGHRDFPNVAKACPSFDVRAWCDGVGIKHTPK